MGSQTKQRGRDREADELVSLKRAALVGRMLLGELHGDFEPIEKKGFTNLPRAEIKKQLVAARRSLKAEIAKFCSTNFDGMNQAKLAALYVPIQDDEGEYRIALEHFNAKYGTPKSHVLKGAPLHSTVSITPWGFQTEYPELHLAKDLVESVRQAKDCANELERRKKTGYREAKEKKQEIGALVRQKRFAHRMALISSFNLVEAYINGVAWEYSRQEDVSKIKAKDQVILNSTARSIKMKDKLIKIPRIVKGSDHGVLHESREPLKTFLDAVKPFRDSIVHASPFAVPERFGGYDKLSNIYELDMPIVKQAVQSCIEIISTIHEFLMNGETGPSWLPRFNDQGYLEIEP